MRAVFVLPSALGKAWPVVEPWIASAMTGADHSADDVRRHIEKDTMQLWLAWDKKPIGCCVTEIVESKRGVACNLVVVAGERFDTWAHLEDDIAQWAKGLGAVRLTLTGRRGWVRRLAGTGWAETMVTLEKAIRNG
jgi:hypothetical protein